MARGRPLEQSVFFPLIVGLLVLAAAPSAQELSESADAPSAFSTVIDARAYDDEFSTVEDVLQQGAGIRVRRFGGLGSQSTASVRGSKSEQVLVLLDGVRLNSGQRGGVDLSTLPLRAIERIEVLRGSGASRFGSDAVGGVISITSREPEPGRALDFSATAGRYKTLGGDSFISFGDERFRSLLGYTRMRSDNDFRFDRVSESFPATIFGPAIAGAEVRNTRVGARFVEDDALWNSSFQLDPRSSLHSTLSFFRRDRGQPGNVSSEERGAPDDAVSCTHGDEEYRRAVASLSWRRLGLAGGDLELQAYHRYERTELHDSFDTNPLFNLCGFFSGTGRERVESVDQQTGIELNWALRPLPLGPLSLVGNASLDLRYDRLRLDDSDPAKRGVLDLSLRPELSLFEGRLRLFPALLVEAANTRSIHTRKPGTPGARQSFDPDDSTELSPSFGIVIGVAPGLRLKSNYGRAFRRPNFNELFHPDFGFIRGNPDLVPEESWNFDVGFEYAAPALGVLDELRIEAAWFHRDIDDSIEFVQINAQTFAPVNLGSSRARGFELEASLVLFDRLSLTGSYTHLDTEQRSNGESLPHRPRNTLFGRAALRVGAARFWLESTYEDEIALTRAGGLVADETSQIDVGVSLRLARVPGLERLPGDLIVSSEWQNLTHSERIDSLGLPIPDRGWYLRVHGSFR